MRNAIGNDDDVALDQVPLVAASNFFGARFAWSDGFGLDRFSAGDEGCRAFEDIKNISIVVVDFDLAWGGATTGLDFEVVGGQQGHTLRKGSGDSLVVEMNDGGFLRCIGSEGSKQQTRGEEGKGGFGVHPLVLTGQA